MELKNLLIVLGTVGFIAMAAQACSRGHTDRFETEVVPVTIHGIEEYL